MTECRQGKFSFQGICGKRVEGRFDGGKLSTDGGLLLIREVVEGQRFFSRFAGCFTDSRSPKSVIHSVESMVKQRVYGLVAGYEDLNDHDALRNDAIFQLVTGRVPGSKGACLASHSTLNRLELSKRSTDETERYNKVGCDQGKLEAFLVEEFIRYAKREKLTQFVLDIDATDIPLHGKQEGRFYHGYYRHYCYLPLYIFCEEFPLWAELRPSNIDASLGTEAALAVIVPRIREAFPDAEIILRGDSGFTREAIMCFCEENGIEFILGLARNQRLEAEIASDLLEAKRLHEETKQPARLYKEFHYQTLASWSKERKVIGKAEHLEKGPNPRFVVTTLTYPPAELYETWYCERGDAENRIKEQFQLFAHRTSSSLERSNQLRLWFSTVAYLVMVLFKKYSLGGTTFERAEPGSIRTRLVKLAVKVTVSARRIYLSFTDSFPLRETFLKALGSTA